MRAAVVDIITNIVINIIVANPATDPAPDGTLLIDVTDIPCDIGKLLFAICTMTTSPLTLLRNIKPMLPSTNRHVATFVTPANRNDKLLVEASNNGQGNQSKPSAAGSVMSLSSERTRSWVSQAWTALPVILSWSLRCLNTGMPS